MTYIQHVIKPGPGRVVIRPLPPDQEYTGTGGITLWVPRPASHEGTVGEIIDAGASYRLGTGETMEPNYQVGQIVLIGKYTGMRITLNRSEELIICKDQDIIGELVEVRPLELVQESGKIVALDEYDQPGASQSICGGPFNTGLDEYECSRPLGHKGPCGDTVEVNFDSSEPQARCFVNPKMHCLLPPGHTGPHKWQKTYEGASDPLGGLSEP